MFWESWFRLGKRAPEEKNFQEYKVIAVKQQELKERKEEGDDKSEKKKETNYRKELELLQTTATKVIKFNAVARLHGVLSYAELIDYGNAATIQTL